MGTRRTGQRPAPVLPNPGIGRSAAKYLALRDPCSRAARRVYAAVFVWGTQRSDALWATSDDPALERCRAV